LSEYEILDLANRAEDQVTAVLQWWGGISFGVLALGHFAARKLNGFLVTLIIMLYVGFSLMMFSRFSVNGQEYASYMRDLVALQETGNSLSPAMEQRIELSYPWYSRLAFPVVAVGTFLGSICYITYAYLRERKSGN
jgi:hypothetical protein